MFVSYFPELLTQIGFRIGAPILFLFVVVLLMDALQRSRSGR